jgi:hypothetical protein
MGDIQMKNRNDIAASKDIIRDNLDQTIQAYRDGWNDVYMDRGFRDKYETAPSGYQVNYERGRQACIYAKTLGMEPKPWRGRVGINIPSYVRAAGVYVSRDFPLQKKAG